MLQKIRKYLAVAAIAAAPIATLLAPGIAHAATFSCTWTGAVDNNFSTAGNWTDCNSAAPQVADTDNLVFPVSATNLTPVNDLVGATFSSITFNGTGSGGYDITGTAFTIAGNITDTSEQTNTVENDVAVTGASTINATDPSSIDFSGAVSGSGSITASGTGSLSFENLTLTGALTVNSGRVQVTATGAADATVSSVTVASGATFGYDAFTSSSVTTYTFSKQITSAGTLDFQGGDGTTAYVLNLTGTITLTGDSSILVGDSTTAHIKGSLHGPGFVLSATSGSVLNESTDNTSATPAGELVAGTADGTDQGGVATPDTGFMLVGTHPGVSLAITLALAGAIFAAARMTRKSVSSR